MSLIDILFGEPSDIVEVRQALIEEQVRSLAAEAALRSAREQVVDAAYLLRTNPKATAWLNRPQVRVITGRTGWER